jgi:hypothetical protein
VKVRMLDSEAHKFDGSRPVHLRAGAEYDLAKLCRGTDTDPKVLGKKWIARGLAEAVKGKGSTGKKSGPTTATEE